MTTRHYRSPITRRRIGVHLHPTQELGQRLVDRARSATETAGLPAGNGVAGQLA